MAAFCDETFQSNISNTRTEDRTHQYFMPDRLRYEAVKPIPDRPDRSRSRPVSSIPDLENQCNTAIQHVQGLISSLIRTIEKKGIQ